MRRFWTIIILAGVANLVTTTPVFACARDGVPSISENGRMALLNRQARTRLSWAPFTFTRTVRRGTVVSLAENVRSVRQALPAEAFTHAWRWQFGDHTAAAYGSAVRHTYRKAGTYVITVRAYFPTYGAWQTFDLVIIHVA